MRHSMMAAMLLVATQAWPQPSIAPSLEEVHAPFSKADEEAFRHPSALYYPETWFHFIGGNVSKEGISADLEAIKQAGISGFQWFHGNFGGQWPQTDRQIKALTPEWEEMVTFMGNKAKELGLRFTVQTCPGWAMAGGPWITPQHAMRQLVWSRTDVEAGGTGEEILLPMPQPSEEDWRDYHDIAVLAFPTPKDDSTDALHPAVTGSNSQLDWEKCLHQEQSLYLEPGTTHSVRFSLPNGETIRTLELPSINSWRHEWVYQPDVHVTLTAHLAHGNMVLLDADAPMSNWQDGSELVLVCKEAKEVKDYTFTISNKHGMQLSYVKFYSAARKHNWRGESGWTLTQKMSQPAGFFQDKKAYVRQDLIADLSRRMDSTGHLTWDAPGKGRWIILRIGHVNSGRRNSPAPPEATGWECDKLDPRGAEQQFAGYVGHLCDVPLRDCLPQGMLMDSWECSTQTWTWQMEEAFRSHTGYDLRQWMPALMGYVVERPESTSRFLLDWRRTLNSLYTENFFRRMTDLAHDKGLQVQYETAAGDILPIDALQYYKYADVPMCEYWQPFEEGFVGDANFKPIYPTASAAHLYGKTRVAAESLTSFQLTWDEHWQMLKDVIHYNMAMGVTHCVFHTYTHNPQVGFLPPGTSFGSNIGTPFLRGQTWWKYMPWLTSYLARSGYMLERGKPVSDVLWYLGDEINHRPNQHAPFPEGYKFDYCNPDVLLHRLTVKDGMIQTPEGLSYRLLWIPESSRMMPETMERMIALLQQGANIVCDRPLAPATLQGGRKTELRFDKACRQLFGSVRKGIRKIGRGSLLVGMPLSDALQVLSLSPDVKCEGGRVQWLHRVAEGADWYFVTSPAKGSFSGTVSFHTTGPAELWDMRDGRIYSLPSRASDGYTHVPLTLHPAEGCFIVFRHGMHTQAPPWPQPSQGKSIALDGSWQLDFPKGWGAPESLIIDTLKAWKDLPTGAEGRAFSGTVRYIYHCTLDKYDDAAHYLLDLGRVDMIADIRINGHDAGVLWAEPYCLPIGEWLHEGDNLIEVDVTGTWFNRLVYDAGQPEEQRKTWTISPPSRDSAFRPSGLLGPVTLHY
ncbi:MAG: glycosyl hydrolase [Bacteroidaceae bacterium]